MYAAQDHVHKPRSMKHLPRSGRHWRVLTIILGMLLSQLAPGGLLMYRGGLLPLGVSGPTAVHAAGVWYVDTNNASASDANSCASSASPCKTIGGALGKAAAGDTINVNPGTYHENLTFGINVTLVGAGPGSTFIDGSNTGTVVTVNGGATVSLSGLTLQHGTATANGAGIYTAPGTVTTISNSSITGNTIDSSSVRVVSGGGIYNQGTLTVDRSTIASNVAKTELSSRNSANIGASATGGGIDNLGTLTMTNSSVINNTAAYPDAAAPAACPGGGGLAPPGDCFGTAAGAGIANESAGTLALTNSTVSGNTVTTYDGNGLGGGIWNAGGTLSLTNATISANTVSVFVGPAGAASFAYGGGLGVASSATAVSLRATILANNNFGGGGSFNGPDCSTNFASAGTSVTSQGYNLIGDTSSCSIGGNTTGNITGQDPLLGPLQNNGGPTQTMLPASGSSAIGASPCTDSSNNPIRTDQRGVSRPVSACTIGAFEADDANDTWTNALLLNQTSGSYQVNQTANDHVYAPTQERWYKVAVTPGSEVHVSFQGDPGAIVSLHTDMQAAYNSLTTPTNAAVESARDAPSGFLPSGFLPSGFLPSGFLPSGFLPSGFLPSGFLPSGFLPSGFLPSGFLPSGFLPSGFLPSGFLPSGFLPGPYSGATWDSLLAISATPNSSMQTIDRNTWNNFGYFYVRVVGPVDRNAAFSLTVTETGGVCAGTPPVTPISATAPSSIPTGLKSLILWDPSRITGTSSDIPTLGSKLSQFASRSEVNGTVIDLSQNTGIESAEAQADRYPACPTAKNIVANDIKSVIQSYRASNPGLQYIVLVGDDHSIPFFRYPDDAGLAPENQYSPPVADSSPSQASLRNNFVLGQDEYGASVNLPRGDHSIPIPDLAVGRLVSTAPEVSHALDGYTSTYNVNGTITPTTSLVTGYDFVSDAACSAEADLAAGTGATPDTLIQPQSGSTPPSSCPASATAWTASDLRQKLLGSHHDVVFLAGHFSAGNLLASDYTTQLAASDVASSTANLTNSLVLALGCHGGYNIPGGDGIAGVSPSPDWPEALAEKGATLLAATGYAYGDTVLTEYGEHLFDNYVHQLRLGSGSVAVGQAEVAAKKEYLASHADLGGLDEKTLLETTLYGLPMLGVNMPSGRIPVSSSTSIVSQVQTVGSGPGAAVQLGVGQTSSGSSTIDVQPSLTTHTVPLTNTANSSTVTTTYLSGRDGTVAHPLDPIYPQQLDNVHVPGQILRGVGFWGGTYTDTTGITPLTTAPATENSVSHPSFFSPVLYPTQVWTANYLDAVSGGVEKLVTTPAQYQSATNSDGSLSSSGTMRQFSDLQFRLYYLPSNWTTDSTISAAAVGAASNIASVSATPNGSGQVTFSVRVLSSPAVGTQDVWVTYTDPSHPGTWTSKDSGGNELHLAPSSSDSTLWQGTYSLPSDIQFMVQAVNGAGLVSLSTNSGAYYTIGSSAPPAQTPAATSITVQPAASTPTGYQQTASFTVSLSSGGTPLNGQQVALQLGGQELFKNTGTGTDAAGTASFTVPLNQPPGSYSLNAFFAGNASYGASQAQPSTFTITQVPSKLTLTPSSASVDYSDPSGIVATLTDTASTPNPLTQRSILFSVTGNGQSYQKSVITDNAGHAQLGTVPLPAGTYTASASFGGKTAPDPDYQSSNATGSLTINPVAATVNPVAADANLVKVSSTGGTASVPLSATLSAGKGDLTTASLTFGLTSLTGNSTYSCTVSKTGGTPTATAGSGSACSSPTWTGTSSPLTLGATFTGIVPGVYKLTFTVGGNYRTGSASQIGVVTVYDPSLGYTVGGGTITRSESSSVPVAFGFAAKNVSGQVQGAWLYIEHRSSGDVVLQSTSLSSLTIVPGTGTQETGYLQGKATDQGTAGYSFLVKAVDANSTGASSNPDQYGQQVKNPSGTLISDLSYNPLALGSGDLIVP